MREITIFAEFNARIFADILESEHTVPFTKRKTFVDKMDMSTYFRGD